MLLFPPCKINIGLHILRKRPDGFHDLDLSFFEVPTFSDLLEIVPSERDAFRFDGLEIGGPAEDNLIWKAKRQLENTLGRKLPPCHISLFKKIPMGSGLGGGSSDAAYTLAGLNEVFSLGIPPDELSDIASLIGSDCAFFLQGKACIGKGRGEILEPIATCHRIELALLVVIPPVSVSTAAAYRDCRPCESRPPLEELLSRDLEEWKHLVENDFEKTLFPVYPVLSEIKDILYRNGALYASLSGSGSAMFGLFRNRVPVMKDALPAGCLTHASEISIP